MLKGQLKPASFWTSKIKLVLFVVLFCKQKALGTLGFTYGNLGRMYSLILTQWCTNQQDQVFSPVFSNGLRPQTTSTFKKHLHVF